MLCMIAENTQRSDGLNIVDEAQALAAVIDLRGGTVSTRKLATAVGHSEGWVRSRLALLSLPDSALDALHAGTITIDVATALTAVAEHPDLVDQLVTATRADACGRSNPPIAACSPTSPSPTPAAPSTAAGVSAVSEDDWHVNRSTWKTLDDLRLDATAHRRRAVPRRGRQVPLRRHRGRDPGVHRAASPPRPQTRQRTRRHGHPAFRDRAGRHGRASGTTPSRRRPHCLGQRTTPYRTPDRRRGRHPAGHRHMDRQRPVRGRPAGREAARDRSPRRGLRRLHGGPPSAISTPNRSASPPSPSRSPPPSPRNVPASRSARRPSPATSTPSNASATNRPTGNTPNGSAPPPDRHRSQSHRSKAPNPAPVRGLHASIDHPTNTRPSAHMHQWCPYVSRSPVAAGMCRR